MATFAEAVEFEKAGRFNEAYAVLAQLSQSTPPSSAVWTHMGVILLNWNRPQEALTTFDQALRVDWRDPYAWEGKARCFWRLSRKQEALQAVDQALSHSPQFVSALSLKGQILVEFDDERSLQWALSYIDQALTISPTTLEALIAKVKALDLLRRWNEAFVVANRIRQIDPDNRLAWRTIALYHWERREFDPALAALDHVMRKTPNDDTVWTLQGGILRNQYAFTRNKSQLDQAIAAFDRALALSPGDYAATQARREALAVRRRTSPIWSLSMAQAIYWGGWMLLCVGIFLAIISGSGGGQGPAGIIIEIVSTVAIFAGWIMTLIRYAQDGRWGRFIFFILFGLWLGPAVIIGWLTVWFFRGLALALSS